MGNDDDLHLVAQLAQDVVQVQFPKKTSKRLAVIGCEKVPDILH